MYSNTNKVILNLSAVDYGGAGKVVIDFHHLLQEKGFQSYLIVKDSQSTETDIIQYPVSRLDCLVGRFFRRFYKNKLTSNLFAYDYYFYNKYERYSVVSAKKIIKLLPAKPDVIFIHWVTDFINAKIIHELKQLTGAKIYWFIVDNAPLTGGCHYPWDCEGFTKSCSNCPAILSDKYKWIASKNLAFKKKHLPKDINIIPFSSSDYSRVRNSTIFRDKTLIHLIGFVDETIFKPGDKIEMRHYFALPSDKKIIFFGASSLKEKRKGMQLLIDALSLVDASDLFLLVAGNFPIQLGDFPSKMVGYLSEKELVMAFQAADMFVCPSIEDSGPMMVNQAIMCGTPVVAFNTGAAQDLVISGETGYRASLGDPIDFARGINEILKLDAESLFKLSNRCRNFALKMYSKSTMIKHLQSLI